MRKKAPKITNINLQKEKNSSKNILIKSINKSMNTLLMILGSIIFYMLLTYIVTFPILKNHLLKTILSGFLEITNGLNNLIYLETYSKIKEIIAISIISFGGLSIHTQIKSILEDTKINYSSFLKGRIIHVIVSICILAFI